MRLLIDANLSPKLCPELAEHFPGSKHVTEVGLEVSDRAIFDFALEGGYVILTKDDDFDGLALLTSPAAKVIRIRLGNCSTLAVRVLLITELDRLAEFERANDETLLILP